jgi:hypothetical protein
MTVPTTAPPPGWYDDPTDPHLIRYWDGVQWSPHAAPRPQGWGQPRLHAAVADRSPVQQRTRKVWWQRWWAIAAAVVVVLALLGSMGDDPAAPEADEPSPPGASQESSEPTATEPEATKPQKSTVPPVVGLTGRKAERALAEAGLVAIVAREVPSPRPTGTVLRQLRVAGAKIREGASVGLVIAAPYPTVPGTAGMTEAAATKRLRGAGFQVAVTSEVVTSGRDGVVLRQSPMGSNQAKPHSVVTIVVASVVRPLAPPAPSNCTPGYSPCLTPASDYDCAGGSGDGPAYTGFVRVTGSDPYDLDRDGDGLACES